MIFLASMEETGLSHDIFFKFSLGPFEVVEVEWRSMLNFEAATSKFCICSWKFGLSRICPKKENIIWDLRPLKNYLISCSGRFWQWWTFSLVEISASSRQHLAILWISAHIMPSIFGWIFFITSCSGQTGRYYSM